MRKNIITIMLAMLMLLPAARADIAIAPLYQIYGVIAIILFIPIVLVESAAAYAVFRFVGKKVGFWRLIVAFIIANIISTFAGILFSFGWHGYLGRAARLLQFLIPAYAISSGIEIPFVYLFIRKRVEDPLVSSIIITFLVNMFSYLAIAMLMLI